MNILKGIGRWVCAFLMSTCISAWIFLATIQTTVLNRDVVKSWLATSGVYDQALGNLVQVSSSGGSDSNGLVTGPVLQKALMQTFPASYIKQNTDAVINSAYDWLEGKTKAITFTVAIQDKATEFSNNLAAQLEPILAKLPACSKTITNDGNAVTCIPKGMTATTYAQELTQPANSGDFLSKPLTQDSFGKGNNVPQLGWLPMTVQWAHTLVWLLPVTWLVLGALYVLMAPEKLRGIGNVGRQATINSAITLIGGLFLWYMSTSIDLTSALGQGDAQQATIVRTIVNPLARTILPDFGKQLSLYSGIVFGIGVVLWLGTFLWRRERAKKTALQPEKPAVVLPEPKKQTSAEEPVKAPAKTK